MPVDVLTDWPWRHWQRLRPQASAWVVDGQAQDWTTLCRAINARAAAFRQQGLAAGDGVALRGRNSAELVLAYLAALQLGARVLPLNPQLPDAQLQPLLSALDIDWGWSEAGDHWPGRVRPLTSAAAPHPSASHDPAVVWQPGAPATLTLTSGSSGLPKGVVHCAANHLASAAGLLAALPFTAGDGWLLSLPLFHVSGQGIVWRWLLRGARLAIAAEGDLAQALAGCSHASLVPTQLQRLLAQNASLPVLQHVLLGGAAIAVALTQRAEQAGIHCWCGYGLTEMASTVTAKRADATPGVGQTLAQRELMLVDGEVWLRGAPLALGYWRDGQIQPLRNAQGWFATRDRGVLEAGELRLLGRLDNLFISGGENIQPEPIEALLAACPDVLQAFVVPVPDATFGQRPLAVLQLRADQPIDRAALQACLHGQIPRYQWPVAYYPLPPGLAGGGIKIARQRVIDWACQTHAFACLADDPS